MQKEAQPKELLVAADGTYTLLHELRLLVWLELFRRERLLLHLGQAQRHGLLPFCALLRRHTLALAAQHRQPSGGTPRLIRL